jgi:hypothetical protein
MFELLEYSPKDKDRILNLLIKGFKRYGGFNLEFFKKEVSDFEKLGETLLVFSYIEPNKKVIINFCFTRGKEFDLRAIGLIQKGANYYFKIEDSSEVIRKLQEIPKYVLNNEEFPGGIKISNENKSDKLSSEEQELDKELKFSIRHKNYIIQKNLTLYKILNKYYDYNVITISGNPGIGKTYTVTNYLTNNKNLVVGSTLGDEGGNITPARLAEVLRKYSKRGHVLLIDEADKTISNEENYNMLKLALGNNGKVTRLGQSTPFNATVIFITNQSAEWLIKKFEAVLDRGVLVNYEASDDEVAEYISLIATKIGKNFDLTDEQVKGVVEWFFENNTKLPLASKKGLSIRTLEHLLGFRVKYPLSWKKMALDVL